VQKVARGRLAFLTLPDGKRDGKGLIQLTSNPVALANLMQVNPKPETLNAVTIANLVHVYFLLMYLAHMSQEETLRAARQVTEGTSWNLMYVDPEHESKENGGKLSKLLHRAVERAQSDFAART
jgi:hypothetical protein